MPLSVTPGSVVCGSAKRLGQSSPIRPLLTLPCNKSLGGLKLGGTRVRSMAHNCRLLIKAAGSLAAAPCESYWVPAACASPPHACRVRALTVSYAPPVPGPAAADCHACTHWAPHSDEGRMATRSVLRPLWIRACGSGMRVIWWCLIRHRMAPCPCVRTRGHVQRHSYSSRTRHVDDVHALCWCVTSLGRSGH